MRIKELRTEKNLTQNEVAKAINTSQRNIGRWENGENEPTASFIILLANYFNVSIDYLLEREDDFGNITIKKETPQFTAEELQIIDNYRTLTPPLKKMIKDTLKTFTTSEENKKRKGDIS